MQDLEADVEKGGDEFRTAPGHDRRKRCQPWIDAADDHHRRHCGAERERSVDGQIGKIENAEGEIDTKADKGIDEPQLDRSE